ncbi:hypothetical protein OWV82_010666 [Melia azedarach]|uniref:Uncharacterized protein n=1 Tax=Melia azedarach TaxID=155640 RepID=A0ACC1Y699_MELAZ|nr:hypothetical protein OWV82_010666 [Melia azedarach]
MCAVDMSDAGESQHSPADSEATTPGNVASSPISSSRTKRYKVRAGRGRSNVIGESLEEGANQSFFLDNERTSVTAEMLAQLRKAYDIPSSVKLLGVAPAQLSSMAWRNLARLYILWMKVLGIEPTIEDVHAIFALTTAPKKPGLYYLRTYTGQPYLVPQVNLNTADKAWDDFWFVVSDDWGQTVVEDGETYVVSNQFRWAGALRGEVPPPSSVTRRMAEGSKTDLAFLQLVRDRMAKATGTPSQQAAMGSEGSGKSVATSSGLPPRPKRAKKVEGPSKTPQLAVDLGGILGGRFAHISRALPALKQVLEFLDSEKGSEVVGLNPNQAIDIASHLFLQAQVDRANELQTSVDKLKTEADSNLLHGYHYAQYQVTREYPDLDLHYIDFGFDRDALVAKFGKDQNPTNVAGSSRQLTLGHPLNLEVSPPHSNQEENDSENQDDEGS